MAFELNPGRASAFRNTNEGSNVPVYNVTVTTPSGEKLAIALWNNPDAGDNGPELTGTVKSVTPAN